MVSLLAIIVNSVSKQFYRSFSNINYGGVIGEVICLKEKRFVCEEICSQRGEFP
jgi:hypothetical protein